MVKMSRAWQANRDSHTSLLALFLEHVTPVEQIKHHEAATEDDEGHLVHPSNVCLSLRNLFTQ